MNENAFGTNIVNQNINSQASANTFSTPSDYLNSDTSKNKKSAKKRKLLLTIAALLIIIGLLGATFATWFFFFKNSDVIENNLFQNDLVAVCKDGKWGFMNTEGELVIKCKYDAAHPFTKQLAPVCKDGKWGFTNVDDELVVRCKYDSATEFKDDLALVEKNGKWGAINTDGDVVIDFDFSYISYFYKGFAVAEKDDEYVCINSEGDVIGEFGEYYPFSFKHYSFMSCGLILVSDEKQEKWGYLDTSGDVAIDLEYEYASNFNEKEELAAVVEDGKFGFIDPDGRLKIDFKYISANYFSEGLCAVQSENKKWGFIDSDGDVVIDFRYTDTHAFKNGVCAVKENGKWGYINKDGDVVIDFKYNNTSIEANNITAVENDDMYYFIDNNGNKKFDEEYIFAEGFFDDGYAIVADNSKKFYVINSDGKQIGEKFDSIKQSPNNNLPSFCVVTTCTELAEEHCDKHNPPNNYPIVDEDSATYEFNENGLTTKTNHLDENKELVGYSTHKYDNHNREVLYSYYVDGEAVNQIEYKYGDDTYLNEYTEYQNGLFSSKTVLIRDKDGNVIKEEDYSHPDSKSPVDYTIYEYNEFGDVIVESRYDKYDNIASKKTYTYDENGYCVDSNIEYFKE